MEKSFLYFLATVKVAVAVAVAVADKILSWDHNDGLTWATCQSYLVYFLSQYLFLIQSI